MRSFFELLSNWITLAILFVAGVITDYFAYIWIQKLPKPESFLELLKYYFNLPKEYFGTLGLSFIAFLLTLMFALGLGAKAAINEDYYGAIRIIMVIFAVLIGLFSLFFVGKALWLLTVLLIAGAVIAFLMNNSNNR